MNKNAAVLAGACGDVINWYYARPGPLCLGSKLLLAVGHGTKRPTWELVPSIAEGSGCRSIPK